MKFRFHLSTLCLLVVVGALATALVLRNARQNAEMSATTARFTGQLAAQAERHRLELVKQDMEFKLQLAELADKYDAQLAAKGATTKPGSLSKP
jgi:hypothetical protein